MPIELIRNPLKVYRIIGENVFSTVLEEDINVPDISSDVYRILASNAVVMIKDSEVMTDKVLVNGQISMNILYSADIEGKPLDSMDIMLNFSQAIEIPGAKPKMKETVKVVMQHIDCSLINSRKVNVKVIMDLQCRLEELFDLELASDVRGINDIQVLREPSSFKQVAGYNKDKYEIREEIELDAESPAIKHILKTDFRTNIKEDRTVDGRVEVTGVLAVNVLYEADDEHKTIQNKECEVPFTQYIEVPAAERGMECTTDIYLSDFSLDTLENLSGEKKVLSIYALVNANVRVYKENVEDIVMDAYSPTCAMDLQKEVIKLTELVGKGHSNTAIKESISIKRGEPEIESVTCINVLPIINDIKLMDDRVVVEGVIECSAVYTSSYSAEPMCSTEEQLAFRHYVEIPGTRLDMSVLADCCVESVNFAPMNSEMIEVRIVLNVSAEVMKPIEKKIINKIDQIEGLVLDQNRMPAITIYLVQKGDTVWSIAKRYNTTVDALVKLNQIENPGKLALGTQILILKTVRVTK